MNSKPPQWFLVTITASWGTGYLWWDDSKTWLQHIRFGQQPVGVKEENLERILREFPEAKTIALPPIT